LFSKSIYLEEQEQANFYLKQLASGAKPAASQLIPNEELSKFFEQSVSQDNFMGLGLL
jgi:hypothetical protein